MFEQGHHKLILASASRARANLLEQTGLSFEIQPANIDEGAIKAVFQSGDAKGDPADIAEILAETKALEIAKKNTDALIIGADQVLAVGDDLFDKPKNKDEAYTTLFKLRGKEHKLISAISIAKNEEILWRHSAEAKLTMRNFSPEFLGQYLAHCGDDVMTSVGCYQLESVGVHLFEEIKGDYFTILGFPLLPLLSYLREINWIRQ